MLSDCLKKNRGIKVKVYLILVSAGHNNVYFEESKEMARAEFTLAESCMTARCEGVSCVTICGVEYFSFNAGGELSKDDIAIISRLSFVYALFLRREDQSFVPIELTANRYFDEKLSRMLKYSGKTNPLFTRMMINVAVMAGGFTKVSEINLLDPIAGKGTTLFEGLIAGYNVYGIEIGSKVVEETIAYFKRYLQLERYKHKLSKRRLSGANKSFSSCVYSAELSRSKEEQKIQFNLVAGNAIHADSYYKKNSMHVIVGDLPYGVQHGNVTNEKQSGITRNSAKLLEGCLPVWKTLLKPGGVVVLAYNSFVTKREEISEILDKSGFTVLSEPPYDSFIHRVDNAIKRDIIVAKLPNGNNCI